MDKDEGYMTTGDLAADNNAGIKKERSSGFPSISLPEAADIIRNAGKYGKQHPLLALAGYAGHKTDNSGPFRQKLAALKDWGFVTVSSGQVTLTPAAVGVAHPTSEAAEAELLREAFMNCDVFWGIYADLAKGVPLDVTAVANKAVATYDISAKAKEKFATSFVHSAVAVGLAESTSGGQIRLLGDDLTERSNLQAESDLELTKVSETLIHPQVPVAVHNVVAPRPVINQVWEGGDAAIVFEVHANKPLSAAAFAEVSRAVQALEDLWSSLS
jgi:hypothetical protein